MKNLKLIALASGLLIASVSFGQRVAHNNDQGTTVQVAQEYIIQTKKLQTYFVDGQIHPDFPKLDYKLTKAENKEIAREWAKKHLDLFTEEAKAKFEL